MEYTIEIVQPNDTDEVLEFLKSSFMKEEPMYKTLDILNESDTPYWPIEYLPKGRSFKAVNSQGEIIAVIINSIEEREAFNNEPPYQIDDSLKSADRKMRMLMNYTRSKFNPFELRPIIDRAVEVVVLSVNSAYRGLGISTKLFDYTIDWVKSEQVTTFVYCVCSSYFSAKVCEKYGMELVYRLPYADYAVDGENPILPEDPHVALQFFVKDV